MNCIDKDTIEIIKDIVTIAASTGAFFIALAGLTAWRKQLKGKEEYELARRLLVAVFKLRNAFAIVRDPAIWTGEIAAAKKEYENDKDFDKSNNDKALYSYRWRKVNEALSAVDLELFEAEALWVRNLKKLLRIYKIARKSSSWRLMPMLMIGK